MQGRKAKTRELTGTIYIFKPFNTKRKWTYDRIKFDLTFD